MPTTPSMPVPAVPGVNTYHYHPPGPGSSSQESFLHQYLLATLLTGGSPLSQRAPPPTPAFRPTPPSAPALPATPTPYTREPLLRISGSDS